MNENKTLGVPAVMVATDDMQAKIRDARARREKMDSLEDTHDATDPLALPGWVRKKYAEAKIHLSFINDIGGAIANYMERGYFPIQEQGVNSKRYAGLDRSGKPYDTVLMGIPEDLFELDQQKNLQQLDEMRADILAGHVQDTKTGRILGNGSNSYIPEGTNIISGRKR